jgi:hypothetical protein
MADDELVQGIAGDGSQAPAPSLKKSELRILGQSMREARTNSDVPLTLKELGSDPNSPRRWSHTYLSRVERGFEVPKLELVEWYERRTGVNNGYLVSLYEKVIGPVVSTEPRNESDVDSDFRLDRIEFFLDFRTPKPIAYQTRDVIALVDNAQNYPLIVDSYDPTRGVADYPVAVLSGGRIATDPKVLSDTLQIVEIDLGRSLSLGDWHRFVFQHELPDDESIARWATIATRRNEVREAVITFQFEPGSQRRIWCIDGIYPEVLTATFGPGATSDPSEILGDTQERVLDHNGFVGERFLAPRAGLHYGLGWR